VDRAVTGPVDPRSPCIIGVGQRTWHPGTDDVPEPLEMWAEVAELAAADAGGRCALSDIDAIHLVHCMSWAYDDGPGRLAQRLGVGATHREVSVLAGTASQRMVNAAAERMLAGQSELALVVGGEALASRRRLRQSGREPSWSYPSPDRSRPPIDLDEWIWPTEWAHQVIQPTLTFAAMDTARRARLRIEPLAYRRQEADLLAGFTDIAAANPHAWFRRSLTGAEIATVGPDNRVISSPYTKNMVAIMDVDMAAALVVATHRKADELGVLRDQRVYLRGWSFGRDATHVAERPFLDRSPAMVAVATDALTHAGIGIDDVAHLDLYSCFASSVLYAADALGLGADDSRPFTVTGGLPYHGGPASNYTAHAIAGVVQRLRHDGRGFGVVSGVGMHMTKHVWAVYAGAPGRLTPPDYLAVQAQIDRHPVRPVVAMIEDEVKATIACYSVTHDRAGLPASALVVADLAGGARAYARTTDADAVAALDVGEWVGRALRLRPGGSGAHDVVL
jgi:acetyl-CoA C-acetyltransferase